MFTQVLITRESSVISITHWTWEQLVEGRCRMDSEAANRPAESVAVGSELTFHLRVCTRGSSEQWCCVTSYTDEWAWQQLQSSLWWNNQESTAVDGAMKLVCLEPVISTLEVFVYKISVTNRPCLTETQPRKFKCCSRCVAFVHIWEERNSLNTRRCVHAYHMYIDHALWFVWCSVSVCVPLVDELKAIETFFFLRVLWVANAKTVWENCVDCWLYSGSRWLWLWRHLCCYH